LPNHFYGHENDLQISGDQNQEMKPKLTVWLHGNVLSLDQPLIPMAKKQKTKKHI